MPKKCVYCTRAPATQLDHLPGEAFFLAPRPNDLITVPVCKNCHNALKKDEDYSRQIMTMSPGTESGEGRNLWDRKARRAIQKDKGLRHAIFSQIEPIDLVTPAGIFIERRMGLRVDWSRIYKFIDKCVRGLFFFEFNELLPRNAVINRQYVEGQNKVLKDFIQNTEKGKRRWPDVFDYRRRRDEEDKYSSLWAFRFFGAMAYIAYTESDNNNVV